MRPQVRRRADSQQYVGGKQSAEEHDFRGKEEPNAHLRVIKPGVLPWGNCVGNIHAINYFLAVFSASFWGVKSFAWPGTLYSYGPRCTSGALAKLPCGGGVGVCHSSVVACHGLSLAAFRPFLMLQNTLRMKGICTSASPTAPHKIIV